ncbi:uncharacterized protein LOC109709405 isoform X2 [Ananas comosus]|uniref:Uncharacterized protein LOC109709405 isoform X2 n=1 Tax=Ananas comosus TaxID=4615 RepID=A0A6P5F145_ANACO|nr:uncharacterized protein LOC109709405 isoform X2 [Ananas comosus]
MASSLSLKIWCFYIYVALICLSTSRSNADQVAGEAGKEMLCFDDNYFSSYACVSSTGQKIYSSCEDQYRLKAEGIIGVAPEATDEYCEGPCFEETMRVLLCIDNTLHGEFRFENSASVEDARNALQRGCSHTDKRDFDDVTERPEGHHDNEHGDEHGDGVHGDEEHHHEEGDFYDHPGEFGYFDHGSKLDISTVRLMMMMMFVISGALLLLS